MKTPKNGREFYFFQMILCLLLIAACIAIKGIKSKIYLPAGSFGTENAVSNLTLTDLAGNLFSGYDEK